MLPIDRVWKFQKHQPQTNVQDYRNDEMLRNSRKIWKRWFRPLPNKGDWSIELFTDDGFIRFIYDDDKIMQQWVHDIQSECDSSNELYNGLRRNAKRYTWIKMDSERPIHKYRSLHSVSAHEIYETDDDIQVKKVEVDENHVKELESHLGPKWIGILDEQIHVLKPAFDLESSNSIAFKISYDNILAITRNQCEFPDPHILLPLEEIPRCIITVGAKDAVFDCQRATTQNLRPDAVNKTKQPDELRGPGQKFNPVGDKKHFSLQPIQPYMHREKDGKNSDEKKAEENPNKDFVIRIEFKTLTWMELKTLFDKFIIWRKDLVDQHETIDVNRNTTYTNIHKKDVDPSTLDGLTRKYDNIEDMNLETCKIDQLMAILLRAENWDHDSTDKQLVFSFAKRRWDEIQKHMHRIL